MEQDIKGFDMKRFDDKDLDIFHNVAIDLANENTDSGSIRSVCVSNIIIMELFNRLLEK